MKSLTKNVDDTKLYMCSSYLSIIRQCLLKLSEFLKMPRYLGYLCIVPITYLTVFGLYYIRHGFLLL